MTTLLDLIGGNDLDVFMDPETGFAQAVTLEGTLGLLTVNAIFDDGTLPVNDYTGSAEPEQPIIIAMTKDVEAAGIKPHDRAAVGLKTYEVIEIRPDGMGLTTLLLNLIRQD